MGHGLGIDLVQGFIQGTGIRCLGIVHRHDHHFLALHVVGYHIQPAQCHFGGIAFFIFLRSIGRQGGGVASQYATEGQLAGVLVFARLRRYRAGGGLEANVVGKFVLVFGSDLYIVGVAALHRLPGNPVVFSIELGLVISAQGGLGFLIKTIGLIFTG